MADVGPCVTAWKPAAEPKSAVALSSWNQAAAATYPSAVDADSKFLNHPAASAACAVADASANAAAASNSSGLVAAWKLTADATLARPHRDVALLVSRCSCPSFAWVGIG